MALIAVDGDTVTQDDAHIPLAGAGTYPISPVTLQDFVFIEGDLIVPDQQTYEAHGTNTCNASTTLLFIESVAVVRDGDTVSSHHSNTGVDSIQQDFCFSD